jgi:hypothetical protein
LVVEQGQGGGSGFVGSLRNHARRALISNNDKYNLI